MTTALQGVIAVLCALAGAAAFGLAGVLQHQATHEAPQREPLRPQLLVDLTRIPSFRWGVVLSGLGFGLQVVALHFGPLILVQPLLVTGVLFYLLFAALLHNHPPDGLLVVGALTALAGLSAFLLVGRPSAGNADFSGVAALPLGLGLVGLVALCLLIASRVNKEIRAVPLAAATAVCYGVTAGLTRSLMSGPSDGSVLTRWQLYAVIAVGPAGFLLNQNAFQTGTLGSVATATITVGDPLVSIGIGLAWLGEGIATGPLDVAGEVLALCVMGGGIYILAGRAQIVAERIRSRRSGRSPRLRGEERENPA